MCDHLAAVAGLSGFTQVYAFNKIIFNVWGSNWYVLIVGLFFIHFYHGL